MMESYGLMLESLNEAFGSRGIWFLVWKWDNSTYLIGLCSGLLSTAVMKIMTERNLRREGFTPSADCSPSVRRNGSGAHRRTLLTGLLLIACSVCFLIQSRTTCPRVTGAARRGLGSPSHINHPHQPLACRPICGRHFLS